MKKLFLLSGLFLFGCAKPTPVIVKVPAPVKVTAPAKIVSPDIYLMCSGKLFKGIVVSTDGIEAVYRCPDEADAR